MRNPFSLPAKMLSWLLALSFIIACWGTEPDVPSPGPTPPNPTQDTKAPVISIKIQEQNVIAGVKVDIKTDQILFDQTVAATWKDDISKSCKVEVGFIGEGGGTKAVKSGDRLEEPGKLQIKVTDEAGNDSSAEIKLTRVDSWAPEISVLISEKNVVAGVKVKVDGSQLFLDDQMAASWKDDYSESLTVDIQYFPDNSTTGKAIESGETLFDAGILTIQVADEFQNKATAEITLTAVAVYWLENLQGKTLQVDQEVNLLEGVTFAEGLTLQKVEIELGGVRSEIPDATKFIPEAPGPINIIFTLARFYGETVEIRVDGLPVNGIPYHSISIIDAKPGDYLPIIGQVNWWYKSVYDHIEHLKIAEATRIRDMMWEYGAGSHSWEEYQVFMRRLNTGMTNEIPYDYDNYVLLWSPYKIEMSAHAYTEWAVLNDLVKHANFYIADNGEEGTWYSVLLSFVQSHPNSINIFWNSFDYKTSKREEYEKWVLRQGFLDLCNLSSVIVFQASSNLEQEDWIIKNKIFNGDYEVDEHGQYANASMANSDKNTRPYSHCLVTVGTNQYGDFDLTNKTNETSKFPVGFDNTILFSGRPFIVRDFDSWLIVGSSWGQASSVVNYFNVALMSICFQMYAEVKDVDELLEMVRSTALTDYIRLDGMTQPLQLINPAGFYKKYLTPSTIPSSISLSETMELQKGYYKGVVFNIPGAEVMIGDEWIPFDSKNKDLILSQNPMNLTWRINGNLLKKMGYTAGQTVQGQIITIDDQWNGLRLEMPMTITIN